MKTETVMSLSGQCTLTKVQPDDKTKRHHCPERSVPCDYSVQSKNRCLNMTSRFLLWPPGFVLQPCRDTAAALGMLWCSLVAARTNPRTNGKIPENCECKGNSMLQVWESLSSVLSKESNHSTKKKTFMIKRLELLSVSPEEARIKPTIAFDIWSLRNLLRQKVWLQMASFQDQVWQETLEKKV